MDPHFGPPQSKYIEVIGPPGTKIFEIYGSPLKYFTHPTKFISNMICTHSKGGPDISAEIFDPPVYTMSCCIQLTIPCTEVTSVIPYKVSNYILRAS